MKKTILFACITLCVTVNVWAQQNAAEISKAYEAINARGEVYFSFNISDRNEIGALTKIISIDDVKGNTVYAYANSKEFNAFRQLGYDFKALTAPSLMFEAAMSNNPDQVLGWDYYPTYSAYESIMSQFAADHPDLARLITIGTLPSGRKLLAIKISDNPDVPENEPEFLYTSSIHGDETTGYPMMLHLIDYLLTNYGTDDRITDFVNNMEIYICPLANPDGTYHGGNTSVNGAIRYNANNVDLNRNYPDPEPLDPGNPNYDHMHPDGLAWQNETVAFMDFASQHHFTMAANFHGGVEVVNYPWDTWAKLTADNNWWVYVSREYADTVHVNAPNGYMTYLNNGITNGYAWYRITGGRQDYMNYFKHCREVTIEISDTKLVPASQLIPHWNYNYHSLLNFMNESLYGLHGIVTDTVTGLPLEAKIFITNFDKDSSHVYTDPAVGDYHRLLKAGTYNVTFSAPGYISKTYQVQIADMQKKTLDVQLFDGALTASFSADTTNIYPGTEVHFTDHTLGYPASWQWEFEGGTPATSTQQNPVITYNNYGSFNVKLIVSRTDGSDTLLMQNYISVAPSYLQGNYYFTTCHGNYFDSGRENSNYSDNELSAITFVPGESDKKITIYFVDFDVEQSANCDNDRLTIYDGPSTTDPVIGNYCGTSIPESVTATNAGGALTVLFRSNSSVTGAGWNAYVVCSPNTGIAEDEGASIKLFPNPALNGSATLISPAIINSLQITDCLGKVVYRLNPGANNVQIPSGLAAGLYFVAVQTGEQWYVKKLQIMR